MSEPPAPAAIAATGSPVERRTHLLFTTRQERSWPVWLAHAEKRRAREAPSDWRVLDTRGLPLDLGVVASPDSLLLRPRGEPPIDLRTVGVAWFHRAALAGHRTGALDVLPLGERARHDGLERLLVGALHEAGVTVVIDPIAWHHLQDKLLQHEAARRSGLVTPRTLVSNDGAALRAFVASCAGGAIYKPFTSVNVAVDQVVWASLVSTDDLLDDEALRMTPLLVQERALRDHELRVIIIGDRLYAGAVADADAAHHVDWRRGQLTRSLTWRRAELPDGVARALLRLMDDLGLPYGAADLIVTPQGEHVFLEVNPTGQFLFVEHFLGYPLADAWLDHLEAGPLRRPRPWWHTCDGL